MSSFLQRRLTEEPVTSIQPLNGNSASANVIDEFDHFDAAPAAPPTPAPASPVKRQGAGQSVAAKRGSSNKVIQLRRQLRGKLLASPDEADQWERHNPDHQRTIIERLDTILDRMAVQLSQEEVHDLREGLLDDLLGFGAIQALVEDHACSEIMVNGPFVIFSENKGKLIETEFAFDDEEHILFTARRIVRPLGRELSRANPMVDARLPDGSRVHVVTDPSALNGTTITIRKFPEERITVQHLLKWGSISKEMADYFEACVVSRLNIVVSGGTGSGKTTLLNVLSGFIPEDERIITIEDSAELQLVQRHVVRLETAPPIPAARPKAAWKFAIWSKARCVCARTAW